MKGPELVDQKEWKEHAEKWWHSFNVNHREPNGIDLSSDVKLFNGDYLRTDLEIGFNPIKESTTMHKQQLRLFVEI